MPRPAPKLPPGATIAPRSGLVVPHSSRAMTQRQFMGRLSTDEYIALTAIRMNPATPFELRVGLEVLRELRDMSKTIQLDDPDTIRGQTLSIQLLAQLPEGTPGRVAPENAAARLAAWRADFPTEAELAAALEKNEDLFSA